MIGIKEVKELLQVEGKEYWELLNKANQIREENWGNRIKLCAIINAKSGGCSEDCKFCAQSIHNKADIEKYPLVEVEDMVNCAKRGKKLYAERFGIVISGRGVIKRSEIEKIAKAISLIAQEIKIMPCASLGILDKETLSYLKEAGLTRYHHNIETAPSYFKNICTTHSFEDGIKTIEAAKEVGLETCCGGIWGMGETIEQQAEMLLTIKELDVNSVPINFLHPIKGTPLENANYLTPKHCLRIIAVARLIMPQKEIRVCGGKEYNLRSLISWIFFAGANATMIGGYLTTSGPLPQQDLQMFEDLGLSYK